MLVIVVMEEDIFDHIPKEFTVWFKSIKYVEDNHYEQNKTDTVYLQLFKAQMKAKDKLETYLFKKRHNIK